MMSFSVKLILKLVCLENVIILNGIFFSFKSLNTGIKNYGFEFDSITVVLNSDI